ncbi:MAG: POTRA domain-containing protein [Thermoanaerobaculia bacterium]|nr:POTRA domain-containing protein [Thermoanaerobaculia bacterium]
MDDALLNPFAALLLALSFLAAPDAPRVARIELRTDDPGLARDELQRLVTIQLGAPLSDLAVRQTLRNLQATGSAAEVAVFSRPATAEEAAALGPARDDQPVVVVVALWAALQIEAVDLVGELGLPRRQLEDEVRVRPGQLLLADHILRSVYGLQDLYERRGYLSARVRPEVARDLVRQRVRVTFEVTAGPLTRVGTIGFEGELGPFSAEALRKPLGVDSGDPLRRDALRTDRERLTRWLVARGHTRALVGEVVESPAGEHEVNLVWPLELGPRLDLEVRGATRKELERERLLPFLELGYDDALLAQAEARIVRWLQSKGHWQATARFRPEPGAAGTERLVLDIEPGQVFAIRAIEFTGVRQLPKKELEARMATQARELVRPGSGRLVSSVLREDLENLRSFYRLRGFPEAVVGEPVITPEGTDLTLTIPVDEGTRRVSIGTIRFEGVAAVPLAMVEAQVQLVSGGGFHPLELEDALARLRQFYEDEGHLSAQVSAEEQWNPAETVVDLRFRVIEGVRTRVDRVILRGQIATRREAIEDVIDLAPGDPISPREIEKVERALYRLGVFRRVDVELAPTGEPGEATRDVLVRVEEGRNLRLAFGPGWDSETQWRVGVIATQPNLFGRFWSLRADARSNFDAEHLARLRLRQPSFSRWDVPLSYELAFEAEDRGGLAVERQIARFQGLWGFGEERELALSTGKRHQFGLAFDYRVVDSQVEVPSEPVERQLLQTEVSSLVPSLVLDFRDDPIDPHQGWLLSAQLQQALPISGLTAADFTKVAVLAGLHLPTWQGRSGRQTLSLGLRLGALEPRGRNDAPISERFIAGGSYSHRAFNFDARDPLRLPDCQSAACRFSGGNGLFLLNVDYRVPIFDGFSLRAFVDSGNVWPDWRDVDFQDFETGVGLELDYASPIGPVRVGYGWKLDPVDGQPSGHGFFAIGYPF